MATSPKVRKHRKKSRVHRKESEEDEAGRRTLFDVLRSEKKEVFGLQQLIVTARLRCDFADRTKLTAHYEELLFQLSKRYMWDHVTGLLLIHPTCLIHVFEASRQVLLAFLEDLKDLQQDGSLVEASKVVFVVYTPESRLFQQWSHEILNTYDSGEVLGEEERRTTSLVCRVLSAVQDLSEHWDTSTTFDPELIPPEVLEMLLVRDELLSPQEYLQLYKAPLNISIDFGTGWRKLVNDGGWRNKLLQ